MYFDNPEEFVDLIFKDLEGLDEKLKQLEQVANQRPQPQTELRDNFVARVDSEV